jgi:predicted PurR-regulated permease PerM
VAEQDGRDLQLRIPFTTMVKVTLFLLLVFCTIRIVPLLAILYVAAMVAVVMAAGADWMEKHHVRRGIALTLIATIIFGAVLLFLLGVVPAMAEELNDLTKEMPAIAHRLEQRLPAAAPYLRSIAAQIASPPKPNDAKEWLSRGVIVGWYAVEALSAIFLTLVIAVYLCLEGKRALAWLFSFAPEDRRRKLVRTAEEVQPVMLAYMRGQLITSSLAAGVAFGTLMLLGVKGAIPLATLAFVGDFIPVLGFLASIVPAVLLALLKSPAAALIVVAAYVTYHFVENYFIVPRVYGKTLRLSTLAVMLSVTFGWMVAGSAGAVLILPFAAAYPSIERIWLRRHLAPDTISKHDAIASDDPNRAERVADDVLST